MYEEKYVPKLINDQKNVLINNGNSLIKNIHEQNSTLLLENFGIVVSDATAKWIDTQTDNTIENLNLTVLSNKLIAIVGPVGAGKVYTI